MFNKPRFYEAYNFETNDSSRNSRCIKFHDKLLLLFIFPVILIDSLTGLLSQFMPSTLGLSAVYKLILFSITLLFLAKKSIFNALFVLFVILVFILLPMFVFFHTSNLHDFIANSTMVLKLATPIVYFFYFYELIKSNQEYIFRYLNSLVLFSYTIIFCNIMLGLWGLGYSSYGQMGESYSIGYKGYFVAGNEVSAVLALCSAIIIYKSFCYSGLMFFTSVVLTLLISILLATKAMIASTIILFLLVPIIHVKLSRLKFSFGKVFCVFSIIVSLVLLVNMFLPAIYNSNLFNKFASVYANSDVIGLILSGRDFMFSINYTFFVKDLDVISLIFGRGIGWYPHMTEVDPADMLFWFGLYGLFYYFFVFFVFISIPIISFVQGKSGLASILLIANLILFAMSFISGHVINSGMLGIIWGAVNSLVFYRPTSMGREI